jgi:coenzyme F420-reducing hydrogenase delta subunit
MPQTERLIVFACNWSAFSALEAAGRGGLPYPPQVLTLRVPCLAGLHPGTVLKAFAHGAKGVLLLGCPPGECRHGTDHRRHAEMVTLTRELMHVLGIHPERLMIDYLASGDGEGFGRKMQAVVAELEHRRVQA